MPEPSPLIPKYTYRVLVTVGIVVLAILFLYFLQVAGQVILLAFAGVMVALIYDAAVTRLCRHTPLNRLLALLLVTLAFIGALVGIGSILGPQMADQFSTLGEQLPRAVEQVRGWLQQERLGRTISQWIGGAQPSGEAVDGQMLARVTGMFSTFFGAIGNLMIILLIGIYIAFDPKLYRRALVLLFPPAKRTRIREVLAAQGHALRLWLLARLVSMTFIGVFVWLGLWALDVPLAFALGLIAALFTFIPYIGPFIGSVPAILVALLEGPQTAFYAAAIYFVVESVESSLVTPIVERKVVQVPPAFGILAQLTAGVLFGVVGVILATPIAVVIAVAVQMLYLQDVWGDDVEVLGED